MQAFGCPFQICINVLWHSLCTVKNHLLNGGMDSTYTKGRFHGEDLCEESDDSNDILTGMEEDMEDEMMEILDDS